jgi:hypothetical protein
VFSWLAIGPAFSNFLGPFAVGLLIDHGRLPARLLPDGHAAAGGLVVGAHARTAACAGAAIAAAVRARPGTCCGAAVPPPDAGQLVAVVCWDVHTFVVPVLGHERGCRLR